MQHVPVLDVRDLEQSRSGFVAALGNAFQTHGFVSLVGHQIDSQLTAPVYEAMRSFFALPEPVKRQYVLSGSGGARGFTPFGVETAKDQSHPDLKEFWHVGRELSRDNPHAMPPNLWPLEVPALKASSLALWSALERLGNQVLSAVAEYLQLPADWFDDKVDHGNSILRPLHYPPLTGAQDGLRSAAHEDINLITLLIGAGEPGLQLLQRDGSWLPIDTREGHVIVNVGDMLQRLTNHVLVSTTHRVVNPPAPWSTRSRYSIPFFLHPNPEFEIETLASCVSDDRPNRYASSISADAYLKQRLREIGLL